MTRILIAGFAAKAIAPKGESRRARRRRRRQDELEAREPSEREAAGGSQPAAPRPRVSPAGR